MMFRMRNQIPESEAIRIAEMYSRMYSVAVKIVCCCSEEHQNSYLVYGPVCGYVLVVCDIHTAMQSGYIRRIEYL